MDSYFTRKNSIEIITGIILSLVCVELIFSLSFWESLPQGIPILSASILQAFLWLIILKVSLGQKFSWIQIGIRHVPYQWITLAGGLALVWSLRVFLLGPLSFIPFFQQGLDLLQHTLSFSRTWEYIIFGFTVVVIAPFVEEIVFRGFVYRIIRSRYSFIISLFLSAGIFGMIHGLTIPLYALNAFLIGIPLAWVYEKSGSLIPGIVMHMTNNALFFILMILLPNMF